MHDSAKLIFDLGAHTGQDTDYYLKLGFQVVAVEANPQLVQLLRERFHQFLNSGQLVIVDKAIGRENGIVNFYVNDTNSEWSSTLSEFGARASTKYHIIEVACVRFDDLIQSYSMPYFLKVDIEGADQSILDHLRETNDRPKYISVELHKLGYIADLYALGFRKFKIVNQNMYYRWNSKDIAHTFTIGSSGPFGEDTLGPWLDLDEVSRTHLTLHELQLKHPHLLEGWFDVHAKFE